MVGWVIRPGRGPASRRGGHVAIRRSLVAAIVVALTLAVPAAAARPPSLFHQCRTGNTHACVQYVVDREHVAGAELAWLEQIPGCESTWSPYAYSPSMEVSTPAQRAAVWDAGVSSMGLFQFERPTWLRLPAWISRHSVWDPLWNAFGAWWLYKHDGDGREWSCTARLGLV